MSVRRPAISYILILLTSCVLFSGCLTRKNALPGRNYPPAAPAKGSRVILTDASSAPRDVRASTGLLHNYADVLGVPVHELRNEALYAFIQQWMGTPHRTGGTDGKGIDCSAFAGLLMRNVYGKSLPRSSRDMAEVVKRKYEGQLREGDLVFFSFSKGNFDHVGIYLHNHKFVHVSTSRGVIISDLKDSWYYKYFRRAGSVL